MHRSNLSPPAVFPRHASIHSFCSLGVFVCAHFGHTYGRIVKLRRLVHRPRMRVIARKTLRRFIDTLTRHKDQRAVKSALDSWFHEVLGSEWRSPADVLRAYANASSVGPERVVFNIKGNSYRLVVAINYEHQIVFVKWIGSHAAYDKIDVRTVNYGD